MAEETTSVSIEVDAPGTSMQKLSTMLEARGVSRVLVVSANAEDEGVKPELVPPSERKLRWIVQAEFTDGHRVSYNGDPVKAMQSQDGHNTAILLSTIGVARMLGYEIDLVGAPT
ncbi:hypothetical protein ACJEDT_12925 [Rhodococcoides fascians]|uniref:hypothetical protein n=1 Tax=Rhodococcoides fascians TaxID=1828 RepID=UPI00389AF733